MTNITEVAVTIGLQAPSLAVGIITNTILRKQASLEGMQNGITRVRVFLEAEIISTIHLAQAFSEVELSHLVAKHILIKDRFWGRWEILVILQAQSSRWLFETRIHEAS
jgi:hypothetical protein